MSNIKEVYLHNRYIHTNAEKDTVLEFLITD